MPYPKDAILVNKSGDKRKVLYAFPDTELYVMSTQNNFEDASRSCWTKKELDRQDFSLAPESGEKWEPKKGSIYWAINYDGVVQQLRWADDYMDKGHRDFLGVFPTEEAAKARLVEIKEKLGITK